MGGYAWIKARVMHAWRARRRAGRDLAAFVFRSISIRRDQRDARSARPDPSRGGAPRHSGKQHRSAPAAFREIEFTSLRCSNSVRWPRPCAAGQGHTEGACAAAERGILDGDTVTRLSLAYDSCASWSNRLQYLDDAPDP